MGGQVGDRGTVSTDMGKAEVEVEVQNQSGSILPSTGSVGTWSIYLIGFVFVLVSFVLYRKFND